MTCLYLKRYFVILQRYVSNNAEKVVNSTTGRCIVWGAVCKATQYKILHHFFGYFWLNYMQYHILLQFIYIAAICVKLLQFIYIVKKHLNRLLIAMVIC